VKKNNVVLLSCLLMVLAYSCSEEKHVEVTKPKSAETEENIRKIDVQIVNLREQLSTLQKADIAQKEAISNLQKQVKELADLGSQPVAQDQAIRDQLTLENHRLAALKEAKRIEEFNLYARLGQLNPVEQPRLLNIAEKIKSGKDLDSLDIRFLERTNFGHEYITEYYAKQPRLLNIAEKIKSGEDLDSSDIGFLERTNFGHKYITEHYAKQGRKAAGSETIIEVFGPKRTKDDKIE